MSTSPKPRQNWQLCESLSHMEFPLETRNGQNGPERDSELKREFGLQADREHAGRGREGFRGTDFLSVRT